MLEQITPEVSLLITIISLIITIIGWSVTYRYQRQILERQIQADKNKRNQEVVFSQRLEQLNEIKNWFYEGEKIWRYSEITIKRDDDIVPLDYHEWQLKLGRIKTNANIIDSDFSPLSGVVGSVKLAIHGNTAIKEVIEELKYSKSSSLSIMVKIFSSLIDMGVVERDSVNEEVADVLRIAIAKIDEIITVRMPSRSA